MKDERYAIPQAFVFCNKNISTQEKIAYLPIYMIGFLEKEKIEEDNKNPRWSVWITGVCYIGKIRSSRYPTEVLQ